MPGMNLHEEILLLALKNDTGKLHWKAGMYQYMLAGALIAELFLDGHINLSQDKKKRVSVSHSERHENALLDEALNLIRRSRKERNLKHWIMKLSGLKKLRDKTARNLCRQGILKEVTGRILLFFPIKKYPQINPEPERQIISRLQEAIFGDGEVDVRTATLIALTHQPGLLTIPFTGKELRRRKKRLKDITNSDHVGKATLAVIQEIQAAITIIAVVPAITGASSG